LRVLTQFQQSFGILVGYSDHTAGIGAAPYAVALGACLIEKHFTLSKDAEGPDHKASLSPAELSSCIAQIRRVEQWMGSEEKKPTASEEATRSSLQKQLVAAQAIPAGSLFSEENIVGKRTGGEGCSPLFYSDFIGKKASRSYAQNDILERP